MNVRSGFLIRPASLSVKKKGSLYYQSEVRTIQSSVPLYLDLNIVL